MTSQELTQELKSAKVGKGCRFVVLSNCVTIVYPPHKLICGDEPNPYKYEGSQKQKDVQYILDHYTISKGKGTVVHTTRAAIQIYIEN